MSPRDSLFLRLMTMVMALMVLFGAAATLLIITQDFEGGIVGLILETFSSMFAAVVGLGAGYMIGRGSGGKGD